MPRKPIVGLFVLPRMIAPARSIRSANTQRKSVTKLWSALMPPSVAGHPGLKSKSP